MIAQGGGSDRDVIFTLKVRPEERAATTLTEWGKRLSGVEKSLQETARTEIRATAKEREKSLRDAERDAKRAADADEREQRRIHDRERERQRSRAAFNRARREEVIREAEREAREQEKIHQRLTRETEKEAKKQADARIKEAERAARIQQSGLSRAGYAGQSFIRAGTDVARGATYIGLAGEQDTQAMLNTVARVEGASAIVRGGLDAYSAAADGLEGLRDAVNGPGGAKAAIMSLAGTAGTAAVAIGAIAAAAAAGKVGSDLLGSAELDNSSFGAKVGRFNESMVARFGDFYGLGLFSYDRNGRYDPTVYTESLASEGRTKSIQANSRFLAAERSRALGQFREERDVSNFGGSMLEARMRNEAASGRMSRSSALTSVIEDRSATMSSLAGDPRYMTAAGRMSDIGLEALKEEQRIAKELVDLSGERLNAAREESRIRISAAQEDVRKTEEALRLQQQIVDTIEGRLSSSAERFGNLSDEDKLRTIQATRRLRAGDTTVSREDRALVKSVGLDDTNRLATAASIAEAERFGFNAEFGAEERAQLETAKKARDKLQQEFTAKTEVVVKIEVDDAAVEAAFQKEKDVFDNRMEEIARRVFAAQQPERKLAPSTIPQNPSMQSQARTR